MKTKTVKNGAVRKANGLKYKFFEGYWYSEDFKRRISNKIIKMKEVRNKEFEHVKTYNVDVEGIICR